MAKTAGNVKVRYCKACKKETRHVRPFSTMPFECANHHADDNIRCATCHRPFSKEVKKMAAALGAVMRYCHRCVDLPTDTPDFLRFCIRKSGIRHHGE